MSNSGSQSGDISVLSRYMAVVILLVLSGCASWQTPPPFDDSVLRARAETAEMHGVKLSAAVLSSDDSRRMFGAKVNETGVQPVWIEVENNTSHILWLMRSGTDPDLFSPLEVAWSFHKSFASETNARIDEHFHALTFENPISPGTSQSGIIFTNPHRQTRLLSIDILGQGEVFPFTLFPVVPDDHTAQARTLPRIQKLIKEASVEYPDLDGLRTRLEQLPCCATSADGKENGDPINVIVVGHLEDIATAFVRRGFRTDWRDIDGMQTLFGRPPDIVARKSSQGGLSANWLRLWVAPYSYQGQAVMLVQTGRPMGWRLHKPDEDEEEHEKKLVLNPNVDEVRNLLIQDMLYSSGLEKLAFIDGVGATQTDEFRDSLGGTRYQTDGLRVVLFLTTRPLSLSDTEVLDWHPVLELHEAEVVREIENDGK